MKKAILYILFFLLTISVTAQKDSLVVQYDKSDVQLKKFDNEQLDDYRTDKEFDYTVYESKPTIFSRIWAWFKRVLIKMLSWLFGVEEAVGILAVVLRIIPYIVLVLILGLLIKFFLKVNMNSIVTGKTEKANVLLTEDEEIISNKNIQSLIDKAISQKNYRLAVRYYYLLVLQKLQENEVIEWEPQKTNEDYIKEIKQKAIVGKFKNLTHLYDFVWYGNFEINEVEFTKVASNFNELTTSIN
ncbi:MAG: DUF4129 domain-containing protein [Flavobacteriaceae bacterium]|nr:DUF4129 domain-containing protein [Flavobacteriaceae bacterium]